MATVTRTRAWLRVASGLMAAGVPCAFGMRAMDTESAWLRVGQLLVAAYGAYLFGYFALRGCLPGMFAARSRGMQSDTGDA